jgi:glycosyltransferase involved in cell wall biosynthesis
MTVSTSNRPLVSFGLPVRNGASTIGQAIESVLTQTFEDWELVISDNLSTDGTSEICARYAAADSRIRHVPTGRDISQNGNFIEVFRLARGELFRWHGDDDWLEPQYAERTVAALEAAPGAVMCTTLQRYYEGDKTYPLNDRLNEIPGVTAADPVERLAQFLRVYRASGWFGIDPIYSLVRRDALEQTEVMPALRFGDFVTSCEISLQGTFTHVPEVLAHRRLAAPKPNMHPLEEYTNRRTWTQYLQREISLLEVWRSAAEAGSSRRRLVLPFARFWLGTQFWDRLRRHVGPRSTQPI